MHAGYLYSMEEEEEGKGGAGKGGGRFNLQSRCFFLGPLTSCVVALQTALLMAEPVMLCCAAAIRSVKDWPDMVLLRRRRRRTGRRQAE